MPYEVQSHCPACQQGDAFVIGDWPRHLGVYICRDCQQIVNIEVEDRRCPGCGKEPALSQYYDYAGSIPYLGGKTPFELEFGPLCPKCGDANLSFDTHTHLNMGMVVHNRDMAQRVHGLNTMEKAIFANSTVPVIKEFQLQPAKVFAYFNLDVPTEKPITKRFSYPIALDIRTHLRIQVMVNPDGFR